MRYCEKSDTFEFKGRVYDVEFGSDDTRHGGPFDRGAADSYYGAVVDLITMLVILDCLKSLLS